MTSPHDHLRIGARGSLRVDRLSLGGDAVGKIHGSVVFVPYGVPGDELEVEITETRPRYARARLLRVLKSSPQRTEPPCPYHFHISPESQVPSPRPKQNLTTRDLGPGTRDLLFCGGCTWQHITYEAQLRIKTQLVQETLERIGGFKGIQVRPTLGMSDPWRYRNKVQQPVGWDARRRRLITGFYAPSSHAIVAIEDCLVQPELSVTLINRTRHLLEEAHLTAYDEKRHSGWIRHLWVRTAQGQAHLVLVTRTSDFPQRARIVSTLIREFPALAGIHQNINPGKTNVILGRQWITLAGSDFLEEKLGNLRFRLSPASFFQVNPAQTEVLYNVVKAFVSQGSQDKKKSVLLDLYCGVGTLALWMAPHFKQVLGVDEVPSAIHNAEQNARLNGIGHARFMAVSIESYMKRRDSRFSPAPSTIILDPPRAGCSPQALHAILRLQAPAMVYVSCDPGTLARDLKILAQAGYRIREVQPVDMFPHTAHIETVVKLHHDYHR